MDTRFLDHEYGYGLVSRFFHWLMALLLLWQVISAALHYFFDESSITDFFFGFHFSNGVLLLCLTLLRGIWGLFNIPRRPSHERVVERLAVIGHILIYVLLVAIPSVGIIRAYGSDRPFAALGVEIFAGRDSEVEWMTNLGGQWHGLLGWTLFALIAGHIAMAFVHTYLWKEPLMSRMTKGSERA